MTPTHNNALLRQEQPKDAEKALVGGLLFLIIGVIASVCLMSIVPPVTRDELIHHLAVPKLWIEKGGIYPIPHLISSYYPMNLDLLYMIPLYFKNDTIPKFIHFGFGLGTAWLIQIYLKEKAGRLFALIGALIFLSTPVVLKLSISAYVDLGLTFFAWASIFFLFKWKNELNRLRLLFLAAVFCGLGLGTKYNGLIVLFILTSFVPFINLKLSTKKIVDQLRAVRHAGFFCLIALIIFSPWMIKNYLWTKNPVYPLYEETISNKKETLRFSIKPLLQRKLIYNETPIQTILIPIRIFFVGQDDNPKFFDGKLNPFLLVFALIPFIKRQKNINLKFEQNLLGLFSILFLSIVYFTTDMRIRYIVPILPPLTILTIFGFKELFLITKKINNSFSILSINILIVVSILSLYAINGIYLVDLFNKVNPIPFIQGNISRQSYLKERLPEYETIEFANTIHTKNNKILGLFLGRRGYYFNSDIVFMINDFNNIIDQEIQKKTLVDYLTENRFSHVMVGVELFEAWVNNTLNNEKKAILKKFFNEDVNLVFSKNGYSLFELKALNNA